MIDERLTPTGAPRKLAPPPDFSHTQKLPARTYDGGHGGLARHTPPRRYAAAFSFLLGNSLLGDIQNFAGRNCLCVPPRSSAEDAPPLFPRLLYHHTAQGESKRGGFIPLLRRMTKDDDDIADERGSFESFSPCRDFSPAISTVDTITMGFFARKTRRRLAISMAV